MSTLTYKNISNLIEEEGCISFLAEIGQNMPQMPKGRNPRDVDTKSGTLKKICESLRNSDPTFKFHWNNRGILATAAAAIYDKDENQIHVTIDPQRNDGHFDGGHTKYGIESVLQANPEIEEYNHKVRYQIFTGEHTDEQLKKIAYNNNNVKPQQARNHADLDGKFDGLKEALKHTSSVGIDNVSFFDGDPGEYRVEELISLEIAITGNFAAKFFQSTSGRAKKINSLRDFYRKGAGTKVKWHCDRLADLERLSSEDDGLSLFAEVVELYNYVLTSAETLYDAEVKKGSYSRLGIHTSPVGRNHHETTIAGDSVLNPLPPIFASMIIEGLVRHELKYDKESENIVWRTTASDAKTRWDEAAKSVIKKLNDKWMSAKANGTTGRDFSEDVNVWTETYQLLS